MAQQSGAEGAPCEGAGRRPEPSENRGRACAQRHGRALGRLMAAWPAAALVAAGFCAVSFLPSAHSGCWKPAKFIEHRCDEAKSNPQPKLKGPRSAARRLVWHGGGAESKDIPDHTLGENQLYRGDGGTLHDYELTGEMISTPGSPDFAMIYAFDVESRFYRFCEGRSDRGLTTIYGREDGWWDDLLKCDDKNASLQMCGTCGSGCSAWEWETTGYALLNGTELEVEDLTWMTHNTYITKKVILPLSVCAQFDWWICIRRLDEMSKTDEKAAKPGMPKK